MRRATVALWLLALGVVVLQAWAFVSLYFQASLDGDIIYPERFVRDALGGEFPLSGWTLSSAPYFFPDFAVLTLLCLAGFAAPVVPYYPLLYYPALALACGAVLRRVTGREWGAWLGGAVLVNLLLLSRGWTDHARALWWLGGPGFHGGAVLLGLISFALWCGPAGEPLARGRWWLALGLMVFGVGSDTLLFTQFVAPIAVMLVASAGLGQWRTPRVRQLLVASAITLGVLVVWRVGIRVAGGWSFSGVFRYAPLPPVVLEAGRAFLVDVGGGVARDQGWFLALAVAGVAGGACGWRVAADHERRQLNWFALAALASTVTLPILSGYWRNPQHARYLLPLFVVPALWGGAAVLARQWQARGVALVVVGLGLAGLGWSAVREVRRDFAPPPYPEQIAQLDAWVRREGFSRGLGDYWTAHYVNATNRSGLWLNQLKPDGTVQFWNNNAFHHFRAVPGAPRPDYAFIVTRNLDEPALRARCGPPQREETVGGFRLWIYEGEARTRLNAEIARVIRVRLADRWGAAPVLTREN